MRAFEEWIQAAPPHWARKKLKHIASFRSGESITAESITDEGDFPVFGGNGLRGYTSSYTHEGEYVLIGRQGALCGNINYASGRFWASEHAIVVAMRGDDDLIWLGAVLRHLDLNRLSQSAAQPGIAVDEVENLMVAIPPLAEQHAISIHLIRETRQIDSLVEAKQRLIDLLLEKREVIVASSVTQGINGGAKMRDSGVAWLGEIPAHWMIERTRWLFRERDERGQPELPLMEVSIASGVAVREFTGEKIEATAADFNSYKVAHKDDVVFNKMRMWQGAVGIAPVDGLVSPDYIVAEPTGRILPAYAGTLFRTEAFSGECGRRSHGLTWDRLRIYWDEFRDIVIPVPPLDEQRAIVDHIAHETARLDGIRGATERTIALLKERRDALLAAAVTGQIDVGAAA